MSQNQITLSEPLNEALNELAACLKKSPEESAELAISFFMQSESANSAILGKERFDQNATLTQLTIDQDDDEEEELGCDLKFHPEALEEYDSLDEEQQTLIICALLSRLFDDEEIEESEEVDEEDFPEVVIHETPNSQLILTNFPFGDLVYELSEEAVSIFLVNFNEDEYEVDDEDEDEDEEFEEDLDEESIEA